MNEAETRAKLIDGALRGRDGRCRRKSPARIISSRESDVRAKPLHGGRYKAVGDATDCLDDGRVFSVTTRSVRTQLRRWQRPRQHVHRRNWQTVTVVPFDERQADIARNGFIRFGKGRHRAGLNFGDCAAYALAIAEAEPLLFKGIGFGATEVEVVALA
jgi:uncharacterized protein with PIN domain